MKAFLIYYLTINLFNVPVSVLFAIFSGFIWLPVLLCTFGLAVALLCYNYYFSNQYYFYYNLGYTKRRLVISTFIFNVVLAMPLLALIALL